MILGVIEKRRLTVIMVTMMMQMMTMAVMSCTVVTFQTLISHYLRVTKTTKKIVVQLLKVLSQP